MRSDFSEKDEAAGCFLVWFGFVSLVSLGFIGLMAWGLIELIQYIGRH